MALTSENSEQSIRPRSCQRRIRRSGDDHDVSELASQTAYISSINSVSGGASGSCSALSCPPVLSTRSVVPRNQASGRREAPGTNGACLPSGSRPETALRSDPGATTTVTRGGIGGDATFWPAQGVPFVCQALTFPQVRAWQPDTRCGWETLWAGLPGVCSRLIDLAERGECLPCESQRRG